MSHFKKEEMENPYNTQETHPLSFFGNKGKNSTVCVTPNNNPKLMEV